MDWWRAYHGLPNDPKLAIVAADVKRHVTPCNANSVTSSVTRGTVLAVWVALLDIASQNEPRGSVAGVDPEQIGWMLEMQTDIVSAIIDGLKRRGCISSNSVTAWDKRNPKREREDDSAERVKRFREKQKDQRAETVTPTVTPCNAMKRLEEREERDKKEKPSPPAVTALNTQYEYPQTPDPPLLARQAPPESEVGAAVERMYALHPKKKDFPLLSEALENSLRVSPLAEIERVHALWCATEDWQKNNGRFAPSLPQWLVDRGYTQEPVTRAGPAKATAVDPKKIIPWNPYSKESKAGD